MKNMLFACLLVLSFGTARAESETRIFTAETCPATTKIESTGVNAEFLLGATILSTVISPIVDAVFDHVTQAVKEAATEKDFPLPPPPRIEAMFYRVGSAGELQVDPQLRCVIVVRGNFVTDSRATDPSKVATLVERIDGRFRIDTGQRGINAKKLRLDGPPEFYFEAAMVVGTGDDKDRFAWRPQALYVGDFVSKDGWFGDHDRKYRVALTFEDPVSREAFASTTFEFHGVRRGEAVVDCVDLSLVSPCTGEKLGGLHGWFATRPASDATKELVKVRVETATVLGAAVVPPPLPTPTTVPEDLDETKAAVAAYCLAIAMNHLKDAACPESVARLRHAYLDARNRDLARIDQQAADATWTRLCGGQQKDAAGLAGCLKALNPPQPAGRFDLTATVIETRPANKVAAFFAPTVAAVVPVVKQAIVADIDPVARAKKRQQEEADDAAAVVSNRQARLDLATTALAAKAAQATYDAALKADTSADPQNAPAVLAARIELLKAESAANDAARKTGSTLPYPELD